MGEIIPALERAWDCSRGPHHQVHFFTLGQDSLTQHLRFFLSAKRIVFLSTMPYKSVAQLMFFLRQELKLSTPFLIYGHDLATVGGVRLFWQGLGEVLRDSDEWIFTCRGDQALWRQCFPRMKSHLLPFPLYRRPVAKKAVKKGPLRLLYVGRLSEQKMLHFSLWALSEFKRAYPKRPFIFDIVGAADGLGSPNMGLRFSGYEKYLKKLTKDLGLESEVIFHGKKERDDIDRLFFSRPHLFFSLSLHSDENFGAAVLRSLAHGGEALLTSWGGHREFARLYPQKVRQISVQESAWGPCLDLAQVLKALAKKKSSKKITGHLRRHFSAETQAPRLAQLAQKISYKPTLKVGPLPLALQKQHQYLWKKRNEGRGLTASEREYFYYQIFKDYSDPLAYVFWRGYGMKRKHRAPLASFSLAPWLKKKNETYWINDPQRGKKRADADSLKSLGLAHAKGQKQHDKT